MFNTSCASFIYTGPTKQQQASSAYKYLMTLFTDGMFISPDQKAVQLLAENQGSVYNYHLTFSTESTNAGLLDVPEGYSPVHGDEVKRRVTIFTDHISIRFSTSLTNQI